MLTSRRLRVVVSSQASAVAYTEFDTETSHQDQVYGTRDPGQIPSAVSIPGTVAVWIRAQHEIVATDATPTTGGSYVTVAITGRALRGRAAVTLGRAVARATFAAHPDTTA
ncbi:MAG: hypothetical protein ACR2NR_12110 [Solirubrobacteraceae bacterium]